MRRRSVPTVGRMLTSPAVERVEAMLRPAPLPVHAAKLQTLGGVWWPRPVRVGPATGEVALFELQDLGELQEWKGQD